MSETWRSDYQITSLPPPALYNTSGLGSSKLVGISSDRMAMVYGTGGSSAFPDFFFGDIRLQLIDPFGNAIGSYVTIASAAAAYPISTGGTSLLGFDVAAGSDGTIAVTYVRQTQVSSIESKSEVFVRTFSSSGTPIGSEVNLNIGAVTPTAGNQSGISVTALSGGQFAASWTGSPDSLGLGGDGSGSGIFLQRFGPSGAPIGALIQVNDAGTLGNQYGSSITSLTNGDVIVSWISDNGNVYGQRVSSSGALIGSDMLLWSPPPPAAGDTGFARSAEVIALTNGGFALAWQYLQNNYSEVITEVQIFSQAGIPVGSPLVLNTEAFASGYVYSTFLDAVASADGGLSVTFSTFAPDSLTAGLGRVHINGDGTLDGQYLMSIDQTSYYHHNVSIGSFTDGREMVLFDRVDVGTADSLHAIIFDDRSPSLYGTANADVIVGHVGTSATPNDIIVAYDGDDTAYGMGGNDYLYMGAGNDVAVGAEGIDVLLLDAGNDFAYGGADQDYIFGGNGNDTLVGEGGVDVLQGEAGDDIFDGGAGGDYIYGGIGNDTAYGREDNDIFVMEYGNDTAFGEAGQDYFYMGAGDDMAHGGEGVDVFLGGAGNDTFEGGAGVDYAWGEAGNDTFIVRSYSGVLVLQDFTAGGTEDVIRLTSDTGLTTFAQAMGSMTFYSGMNTTILTINANTSIWFIGVNTSQFTAADFAFV